MMRLSCRRLLVAWLVFVALFWAATIHGAGGLFSGSLSVDFRSFWAATQAFLHTGPASAYDMPTLNTTIQRLAVFNGPGAPPLEAAPAPYPPPFFLVFAPFAILPPALGFALWTLLNLGLACAAVQPAIRRSGAPVLSLLVALTFFPLAFSLYAGQPSGLLLFGLAQVFWALRAERDFRAGLWMGVLLLKPQYAIGIALTLLLKRRRRALAGTATAAAALGLLSLALLGLRGALAYRSLLSSVAGFRSAPAGISPRIMIGWRGLLLNILPGLSDAQGATLALALSALTLLSLVALWRGPWRPAGGSFPAQFLATTIATLVSAYHSHIYGAALLLTPVASLDDVLRRPAGRALGIVMLVSPYLLLLATGSTPLVACVLTGLMVTTLGLLLLETLAMSQAAADVPQLQHTNGVSAPTKIQ